MIPKFLTPTTNSVEALARTGHCIGGREPFDELLAILSKQNTRPPSGSGDNLPILAGER